MSFENNTSYNTNTESMFSAEVEAVVDRIEALHNDLSAKKLLHPSDEVVNQQFSKLVQLCKEVYPNATVDAILSHKKVTEIQTSLRKVCSDGECQLEVYWAEKIKNGEVDMCDFVYHQNYEELVLLELELLQAVNAKLDNVVFVGSGPLPLSSIILAKESGEGIVSIDNVDMNADSNSLAEEMVKRAELESSTTTFKFHTKEACGYEGYGKADVVILGALVGESIEEKKVILQKIASEMRQDAVLLVRTAHSLRQLLYPAPDKKLLEECGFRTQITGVPGNDVINSVLIATKSDEDRVQLPRFEIQSIRAACVKLINTVFVGSSIYNSPEELGDDLTRGEMGQLISVSKNCVHQFAHMNYIDAVVLNVRPENEDSKKAVGNTDLMPDGVEGPLGTDEVRLILERLAPKMRKGAVVAIRSDYPFEQLKESGYEPLLKVIPNSHNAKSIVIARPKSDI